jgi:tRNA(fMet)-specific endonuclease VapC
MALLIDTDLLIDLEQEDSAADGFLGTEDCAISVITVSELLHGMRRARGARRARRHAFVEYLLADLKSVPITEPVARVHADIWADLSDRGEPIGSHDLWIAATAMAHGFGVATRNAAHFTRVRGLRVIAGQTGPAGSASL